MADTAAPAHVPAADPLPPSSTSSAGGQGEGREGAEGEGEFGYIKTAAHNYVSRNATIHGPQNVELRGKTIIERGVNIYGDEGSKIRIGRYCAIGEDVALTPASYVVDGMDNDNTNDGDAKKEKEKVVKYLPLIVGSNTYIGCNTTSQAAAIGSSVIIGNDCTIGNRCIIKDCVYIEGGSVLPDDMVVPPFAIVRGCPARLLPIDVMPESCAVVIPQQRVEEFGDFVRKLGGDGGH